MPDLDAELIALVNPGRSWKEIALRYAAALYALAGGRKAVVSDADLRAAVLALAEAIDDGEGCVSMAEVAEISDFEVPELVVEAIARSLVEVEHAR